MSEPAIGTAETAPGVPFSRAGESEIASELPLGLRRDWPAPRYEVIGSRDGFAARLECQAMLAAVGALSRLPLFVRNPIVDVCARVARATDAKRTRVAHAFLRQALGPGATEAEIRDHVLQAFKHLFHVTIDVEGFDRRVPASEIRDHYTVEFCDAAQAVLAARRGSILVTPHLGDWEAGSAILPWLGFDPFYVVSRPVKNRPLSKHIQRVRERRGVRLLPRRGGMKDARAVVESGGMLTLMLDQRANHKAVIAPFFGRPARCDRSAGVLVKRLGAPVLVGACFRTDRPYHYRACIPTVIEPAELASLDPVEIATRVNLEMEQLIRRDMGQYFWLHDRYRDMEPPSLDEPDDGDES
jgi:KDO2-lipid IV(A) lauroyltransferase